MDRLMFCQSINIDPALQVKDFFNEVMGMYNLVENLDYRYINGSINENNKIQFTIGFDSPNTARIIESNLNGNIITVYNENYMLTKVEKNYNDKEIALEFYAYKHGCEQ